MIKEDTLILGGGVVGLSLAFLKGYKIVTDVVAVKRTGGPKYLYDTPEVRRLLRKLGITYSKRVVRVGYMYRRNIYSAVSKAMKEEYSIKTRGTKVDTAGSTTFEAVDLDFSSLIQALWDEVEVIHDTITTIYPNSHVLIGKNRRYFYGNLITTIPAPIFAKLAAPAIQNTLVGVPLNYVISESNNKKLWEWDYVYCIDRNERAFRIVPLEYPKIEVEYPGALPPPWKIVGGSISYPESVKPAGRFARWKDGWMLHDELKEWM